MARKILIIDDGMGYTEVIGKRLESWGYEVVKAFSGKTGIEALKNKKPDIIILDYMMPEMDGVDTLKQIRKMNKDIPVIMFTAFPDRSYIKGAEGLDVSAYIPKISAVMDVHAALKTTIKMLERKLQK